MFRPNEPDYYQLLGVNPNATADEIRKAYRMKALELHPDRHPNETEKYTKLFQPVGEAYEIIGTPTKRAEYDARREVVKDREREQTEQKEQTEQNLRAQGVTPAMYVSPRVTTFMMVTERGNPRTRNIHGLSQLINGYENSSGLRQYFSNGESSGLFNTTLLSSRDPVIKQFNEVTADNTTRNMFERTGMQAPVCTVEFTLPYEQVVRLQNDIVKATGQVKQALLQKLNDAIDSITIDTSVMTREEYFATESRQKSDMTALPELPQNRSSPLMVEQAQTNKEQYLKERDQRDDINRKQKQAYEIYHQQPNCYPGNFVFDSATKKEFLILTREDLIQMRVIQTPRKEAIESNSASAPLALMQGVSEVSNLSNLFQDKAKRIYENAMKEIHKNEKRDKSSKPFPSDLSKISSDQLFYLIGHLFNEYAHPSILQSHHYKDSALLACAGINKLSQQFHGKSVAEIATALKDFLDNDMVRIMRQTKNYKDNYQQGSFGQLLAGMKNVVSHWQLANAEALTLTNNNTRLLLK